jgi:alkylated DNA repair dioxygenase AlkB
MSISRLLLKNKKTTAGMAAKLVTSQDLGSGSIVEFYPHLLSEQQADELFTNLTASTFWESRQLQIMGHSVTQPRLTAYFADSPTLQYTYSGTTMHPRSWEESPSVSHLKSLLESILPLPPTNISFNSCLINYYRSGQDHLSWHSDNEPLYGPTPTIASISLGCKRDFIFRENANKTNKITYSLGHGDVLVMKGAVQQYWQHCVPKRKQCIGPRISLTFRTIVLPEHKERKKERKERGGAYVTQ